MRTTTSERRSLLEPLVNPAALESSTWIEATWAAVVFSHLTEPADEMAGQLAGILGYPTLLDILMQPDAVTRIQDRLVEAGVLIHDADIEAALKRWRPRHGLRAVCDMLLVCRAKDIRIVTQWDDDWPEGFDRLGPKAPHVLYVRGQASKLNDGQPTCAIVGARAATSYGEHVTMELAADLALDHTIVSGAAYGIDGSAHRAVLALGGTTIAYLAGGVDRPYPMGHSQLIERITLNGAIVSEVPPGSAPTKWRFLARNRLIAAHASATIVVEAGYRSGSLNTASHAMSAGRPVGAVPGPLTSAASAGCHRLIREYGATLITSAADVRQLTVTKKD